MPLTINNITNELTDYIVENHDGRTSLFVYKSNWCTDIGHVLTSMDINYRKSHTNWEKIAMLICNESLGIVHSTTPALSLYSHFGRIRNTPTAITESVGSSSIINTSKKQLKLLPNDKTKIIEIFESLDLENCWTLSTGTIVKNKMKEYAISCNYEHPVHSLILDTSDKIWKKYFAEEELLEIKTYNNKGLNDLPPSLQNYIDHLKTSTNSISLKKKLVQEQKSPACEWLRNTILEYIRLFR
ncbi:hypothetical protein BDF14DRAFT_916327 [Spinellus fusiger]|nr:hypothetical protein BDF14DRAFT_916327 [Spinellus fusiger]